jgi:prevent-host-death family protein
MSDTPEEGREPLPASAAHRTGGPPAREARTREPGRPASRAEAAPRAPASRRIGIRELRQHASVYVDLAEQGYTVDITNRGRLVARLIPVGELGSPLERLIAAGIVEAAEEPGGVGDIEPYPGSPAGPPAAAHPVSGHSRNRRPGGR